MTTGLVRVMARSFAGAAHRGALNRSELAFTAVFYLLVTTALTQLWEAAAETVGGSVVGYSATALVWYLATTEVAVNSIPIRVIEEIGDDITSRRIEIELLRPTSIVAVRIAGELGRVAPRLVVCVAVGAVFAPIVGGPVPNAVALALAVPAVILAVTLNLTLQHAFAAITFWVGDTKSGWFVYQKLVFLLGGMLLPLEVLPGPMESVAKALPLAAVAYVPGRLAAGYVEPWWLLAQVGWLAATVVITAQVFNAGLSRLQRTGG